MVLYVRLTIAIVTGMDTYEIYVVDGIDIYVDVDVVGGADRAGDADDGGDGLWLQDNVSRLCCYRRCVR